MRPWYDRILGRFRRRGTKRAPAPRTVAAAPVGIAALVGAAAHGPAAEAVLVHCAEEARRRFGGGPLVAAAGLFFANGGREALLVRGDSPAPLEDASGWDLLALPAVSDAARVAEAAALCGRRRAFLLVDAPAGAEVDEAVAWAAALPRLPSCAVYFPRLRVGSTDAQASAAVAGVVARLDVWQAPAGERAVLASGAPSLALGASDVERLVAARVNVLRALPGGRTAPWSARTLSGDAEWRYVNVRRLFLFLERSLDEGTRWVVFEPHAEPTWAEVRRSIAEFLLGVWRSGALQGATPRDAYFVRCDRSTMPQDDLDEGRLVALVGVAPVRPAEFVVIRIEQLLRGESGGDDD